MDSLSALYTLMQAIDRAEEQTYNNGMMKHGTLVVYVSYDFYARLMKEYHSARFNAYDIRPINVHFDTFLEKVNGYSFYAVVGTHHPDIKICVTTDKAKIVDNKEVSNGTS